METISKYPNSIGYCYKYNTNDSIIEDFEGQKEKIRNIIDSSSWDIPRLFLSNSVLFVDKECLYNMGKWDYSNYSFEEIMKNPTLTSPLETLRINYSCNGCNLVRRMAGDGFGQQFYIQCGKYAGTKIRITSTKILSLENKILDLNLEENKNINICTPKVYDINKTKFIGANSFTNSLVNQILVEKILEGANLSHLVLRGAFVCSDRGYFLEDVSRETPSKPSKVLLYISQLREIFKTLSKSHFSMGRINQDSLVFTDNSVKLRDFTHSSITADTRDGPVRFFNLENMPNNMNKMDITNKISMVKFKDNTLKDSLYYKIGTEYTNYYEYTSLGIPLFRDSWDLYCCLLLIYSDIDVYREMSKDIQLYSLWKNLWLPGDFKSINRRLMELVKKRNREEFISQWDLLNVLKDYYLKCNLIDHLQN